MLGAQSLHMYHFISLGESDVCTDMCGQNVDSYNGIWKIEKSMSKNVCVWFSLYLTCALN